MSKKILSLLFFILISFHNISFTTVKGSETAVSIEPAYTFPAADSDNKMLGFGWFKNGFSLEDNTTTCTFDSAYPVSGEVDLNGGVLYLEQDLIFKNVTTLLGFGHIFGNNHYLEFCSSISQLPTGAVELCDVMWNLNSDFLLTDTVTLKGNCIVTGHTWDINLGDNGCIIIDSNARVTFSNIGLHGVTADNFIVTDDTSQLVLENAKWELDGDYHLTHGSILFQNSVDFVGSHTFHYDSKMTSTIKHFATLNFYGDLCFEVGRKDSTDDIEPLYFETEESFLRLRSCSFIVTGSGMCLSRGKLEIDSDVTLDIIGTTTSTGLVLGSGNEGEDVTVLFHSGTALHFLSGQLVYNNFRDDRFVAFSDSARVTRYEPSKVYVAKDWVFPSMVVKVDSGNPETVIKDGVAFGYTDTKMVLSFVEYNFTGHQSGSFLNGNDHIYLSKGNFILPLFISGAGNRIFGNGNFTGGISLLDGSSELSIKLNGNILENVNLAGGTVTLAGDLNMRSDAIFSGVGTIDLDEYSFDIGGLDSSWTSTILWKNNGGNITFSSRMNLDGIWQFDDSCIINGNGNEIDLGDTGQIIVKNGVNLTLRNIVLHTVSEDDIYLEGDDSSLVLDGVIWLQDSDVRFDTGSIKFLNDVDFRGGHSFIYESARTSTIAANSKWKITKDMTLQIGRKEAVDYVEPLYFENGTSNLRLDDCSFVVTGSGMQILRGMIEIDRDVYFDIVGTTTVNGLMVGSGVEAEDAVIKVFPGAALYFRTGMLIYNNATPDKIVALSESARFVCYGPSKTHIARDCTFPQMVMKLTEGIAETTLEEGVDFGYNNTHFELFNVEFNFTGKQYCTTIFNLEGDGLLYLTKGNFMLPLAISSAPNYIWGTGNITGPVMLQDSDANVSCDLSGILWGQVSLNSGVLELGADLALGGDYAIDGPGQVHLMRYNLVLGGQDAVWTSTIDWHSNGLGPCPYNFPRGIDMNAKVSLSGKWNIQDRCMINGHGNVLDLGEHGTIEVQCERPLILRNLILRTAGENNLYCLHDDTSIIFDNVTWIQDSNVTFTKGSMRFENDVDFVGTHSFVYDSARTSTIASNSNWTMTDGLCLRIGKQEIENSAEPLYFEDGTSVWHFKNSSFVITGSGMQVLRGVVEIDGDVGLDIVGTTTENSLMVGSGIASEDATIKVFPGGALYFNSGMLVYNNCVPDKIIALSDSAQFILYGPSKTHIARDCIFPSMVLKMTGGIPETTVEEGVNFCYENTHVVLFNTEFDFTGKQYCTTIFNLEGSDLLYLTKGSFMLPVMAAGLDNYVWGTGNITGPITLQDSDTHVSFDLNGALWGQVTLNDSILELGSDLMLGGDYAIDGAGQVRLMRYNLILGGQDSVWTSTIGWHSNGVCPCPYNYPRGIDMHSKVSLSGKWDIQDRCMINGNGNTLDLGEDGAIEVQCGTHLMLRNLVLRTAGENNLYCLHDEGSIIFDNVTWVQDSNVTFTKGSMCFRNNVDFVGTHSFVYDSSRTSTIASNCHWMITDGLCLRIGKQEVDDSAEPLYFEDDTSTLHFKNCSFVVTGSGMQVLRGMIEMDGDVTLDVIGTATDNSLIVGSGVESDDATIKVFPGAALYFRAGMLVYNNSTPDKIVALSESARFVCYGPSKTYIARDCTFPQMVMKLTEGIAETILAEGVDFGYNGTHFELANVEFSFTGKHRIMFDLEGNGLLYLTKGNFMLPLFVSSTPNYIWGAGTIAGPIILQDSSTCAIFDFTGIINTDIAMNGGTIVLGNDLCFSSGYKIAGSGVCNLSSNKLTLGAKNLSWPDAVQFIGTDGGSVDIRSRIDLLSTWTFSGDCIIDGHGNTIDLSNDGNIVIDQGSKVTFRDLKIIGISQNNVRCLDDDSLILLENSVWVQDENYSFTTGALQVKSGVKIEGPYEFSYETRMTSTILKDSTLKFRLGSTLEYNPTIVSSKDLIEFYDDTSYLSFHSSYLHTNTIGMNFKRGNLVVKGNCDFSSDTLLLEDDTIAGEGITIGTGTEVDDCVFKISMGSLLNVSSGVLTYNNVAGASFIMENRDSILKIMSGAHFVLNQDISLADGLLSISDGALLDIADGKNIIGSVSFVE